MINYDLFDLVKSHPEVTISVSGGDLIEMAEHIVRTTCKELEQLITDSNTETYPSPDQVAKILSVDRTTLWRWHRSGYLTHFEIGGKRRYRMSDIKKLMGGAA